MYSNNKLYQHATKLYKKQIESQYQLILNYMERYSFQHGINQVKVGRKQIIRNKIMRALDLKSVPAWYQRLNGNVEPKVSEAKAIEEIFAQERPPIREVWGIDVKVPQE